MLKIKEKNRGNKRRKEGREERREEGKKKNWVAGRNLKSQCWGSETGRFLGLASQPVQFVFGTF